MSTTENAAVEDGTGQQVLDEMNELFLAEVTKFSSTTEPASPEPYQNWVNLNLAPPPWMVRNGENTGLDQDRRVPQRSDQRNPVFL